MLARNHDDNDRMTQLATASDKYLEGNVQMLKRTEEFLQDASSDFLNEFLDRDELSNASEEKQVFNLVLVVR